MNLEARAAYGVGGGWVFHVCSVPRTCRGTYRRFSSPALLAVRRLVGRDAGYLPFADFEPAARLPAQCHHGLGKRKASREHQIIGAKQFSQHASPLWLVASESLQRLLYQGVASAHAFQTQRRLALSTLARPESKTGRQVCFSLMQEAPEGRHQMPGCFFIQGQPSLHSDERVT